MNQKLSGKPGAVHSEFSHDVYVTDRFRLDGNNICCSIESVNFKMFAHKFAQRPNEWMILALNSSVLWEKHCRYCWRNASSKTILRHGGRIDGPWAFRKMFEDVPATVASFGGLRQQFGRSECEPTFSDAEVQIVGPVEQSYFLGTIVQSEQQKRYVLDAMSSTKLDLPVLVMPDAFQ